MKYLLSNMFNFQARKEQNNKISAAIKPGDIFVHFWGFEQPNVDFYQVIRKISDKEAIIKEIGYKELELNYIEPVKDYFLENAKEETVILNGKYFSRGFSRARLLDMNNPKEYKIYISYY